MSRRRRTGVVRTVVVCVALVAGSGCAGSSGGTSLSPGDQYLRALLEEASPRQVDEIFLTVIGREEEQVASCMRAAGFDYRAAPADSLYTAGNGISLDDPKDVQRFGFGISTRDLSVQPDSDNPNDAIYAALDEAARVPWSEQRQTCAERAHTGVGRRLGIDQAARTAASVAERIRSDPRVVAATGAWRTCMRAKGYEAADREELIHQLSDEWQATDEDGAATFRAKELAAAGASHACGGRVRAATADARADALRTLDADAYGRIYR